MRRLFRRSHAVVGAAVGLLISACSSVSKDAPAIAGENSDQLSEGRRLFAMRCIECHALPSINGHKLEAWPHLVRKMSARAGLSPEQREAVLAYIVAAHWR